MTVRELFHCQESLFSHINYCSKRVDRVNLSWRPLYVVFHWKKEFDGEEDASLPRIVFCLQSSEILTLTYGGIVRQLVADNENVGQVNTQLKKMYVPWLSYLDLLSWVFCICSQLVPCIAGVET